jgi:phage terminase large subunit
MSQESSEQDQEDLPLEVPHWMEPVLTTDARYIGIHGGRGGGKSWGIRDYLLADHIKDPDLSTVCLREVQRSLDHSSKRLLEQKILACGLEDYFDIRATQIRRKDGSGIIVFQGLSDHTAESIKSLEGFDRFWIDEAQAIKKRSLDILRPTVRKRGAKLLASWNPGNDTDPIDVLLRGPDRVDDSVVVEANYYDNPWFPKSLIAEAQYDYRTDPEKFAHVWLGQYVKFSEARVFKNWKIEEFEAPKDAVFRFGLDWGFSPDPIVLVRGFIEGRKLYIDHEAYQVGCEIEDTPGLLLTVPESENYQIQCASDRPERIRSLLRHGFKAVSVRREQHSVQEGVDYLKGFQIIAHPRCKRTIAELRLYSRKIDPLTQKVLPVLEDKHNHCIDAMRHLVDPVRRMGNARRESEVVVIPRQITDRWGGGRRG